MSLPRYPKYKDSGVEWLGEVPEHWVALRLKRLATIQNGRDYREFETESEGYPVIGSGGEFARASAYLYDGESVLLGRKGTIDRPLYINGPFWPVDTMFYTKVRPEVSAKYLYYCALTIRFDLYSTSTALPSMTQSDLCDIFFAVPEFVEQCAIVAFLDREARKVDALVEEQRRLIELLKEKRQAVISHAVTKGLNPNAPMKDSGIEWIGELPEYWNIAPLRRAISEHLSNGIFKKRDEFGLGVPLVNVSDVYREDFKVDFDSLDRVSCDEREIAAYLVMPGDLFFVRSSLKQEGIAAVALAGEMPEPVVYECHLIRARPNVSKLNARYGSYLLNSAIYRAKTMSVAKITTMTTLDQEALLSLVLPLPPIEEQQLVSEFLDSETAKIDCLMGAATHAIDLLQERRTALISAAVTGKIDVRGLVKNEVLITEECTA